MIFLLWAEWYSDSISMAHTPCDFCLFSLTSSPHPALPYSNRKPLEVLHPVASSLVQLLSCSFCLWLFSVSALLHFLPFVILQESTWFSWESLPSKRPKIAEYLYVTLILFYHLLYWQLLVSPIRILRTEIIPYLFLCISASKI